MDRDLFKRLLATALAGILGLALGWALGLAPLLREWLPDGPATFVAAVALVSALALIPPLRRGLAAIDARERSGAEDRRRQRLARVLFDASDEAVMITDAQRRIIAVNAAYTRLTGYTTEELAGHHPRLLHCGRNGADFYSRMRADLDTEGRWAGEIWNRRKNGGLYLASLAIAATYDDDGRLCEYVGVSREATVRRLERGDDVYGVTHDPLTGLPNRLLFHDRLERAVTAGRRRGLRVALMHVDIDDFRWVNDNSGHRGGDALLQQVAERLRHCVRDEDTVSRMAGDSFMVILPSIRRAADVDVVAAKIYDRLGQPFDLESGTIEIGASIGIALFPDHAGDPPLLIGCADAAMYAAKRAGRGRHVVYAEQRAESIDR